MTNVTTLSGDLDGAGGTVDAYHVLLTLGRTSACVVDGFTITGGRANAGAAFAVSTPSARVYQNNGAGMNNISGSPTVSNCTFISNTASYGGGGIYNSNSVPIVSGCVFASNMAVYGGGMYHDYNSGSTISNCVFTSNVASNSGGAIHNEYVTYLTITNSTFFSNTATTQGGALYYNANAGGSVTNCILYGSTSSGTGNTNRQNIYKAGVSNSPLTVSYSRIGDYSATATNNYTSGAGIITSDPLFLNAGSPAGADGTFRTADDGFRISCTSPARNAGTGATPVTDILGNPRIGVPDLGAYEADATCLKVVYVNGSQPDNTGDGLTWTTAKKDVQAAINVANSGDTIWVKGGTYLPTLDPNGGASQRDKTFYLTTKDVKLYGGFSGTETAFSQRNAVANVTTLSGDLDGAGGTVDAYHVLLTLNRTSNCVVDGFTITGGRANGTGSFAVSTPSAQVSQEIGAGMYNTSSSPTVSNCTFASNAANHGGAGLYNSNSSPTVSSCTFSSNTASYGGGMYNINASNPMVNSCVFSANAGGNVGGGMYTLTSSPTVSNSIFTANTAYLGGAMYTVNSSLALGNCTFAANTASGQGGGLYFTTDGGGSITNCILYGNTGGSANQQNISKTGTNGSLTVSYSLIGDYSPTATNNYNSGAGISTGDPLFVNAASPAGADGRFRTADDGLIIKGCSPARDAGTGATPTIDILGNPRVGALDLGAYETNVNCPKVYYVNGSQPNNNGSGLTWATAKKDLQAAICFRSATQ
ncbi:MAG: hypothetical protein EOP52_05620 [Sphingobacteriales bacterium]|nr:MAG: hypothetical protein EOP52_05620 [Sphingobacteriales bacterium]